MKNNKKHLAAKILLTLVIGIYHTIPAFALPNQGTLDNSAAASIATQGTTMSITGKGANNILNWATFSIDKGETVKFTDKNNYLNLVRGVDISRIYGTMSGGGTVYLVNPNGILFGQGARLDNVGSFIASTRNISAINQDAFLNNPNDTTAVLGTDSKEMDNKDFYPSNSTYVSKLSVAEIQLTNVPQSATKIILDGPGGVILKNSALLDKTTQILTRKDGGEIGIGSDAGNIALTDAQKAKISLIDGDTTTAFNNNSSVLKGYKTLKSMNDIHAMGEAGNSVKNYILVNDIDASNNGNYTPNSYEGTFDGLGYKIKNLTVNPTSGNKYGGLFTHYDGTVRNVGIDNVSINGGYERTGSYVPQSGRATGGLAGTFDGEITNVYVTGSVSGYDYVGGLVGQLFSGEIRNSHNDATVSLKGMYHAGGIVGDSWGSLFNVYNTGDIEAGGWRTMVNESGPLGKGSNFTEGVGGIVGSSRESDGQRILFAYNKGNVTGGDYVGGIAGYLGTTAVGEVYNLGKVVARNNTFLSPSNLSIFPENANKVYESIGGIVGAEGKSQGFVLEHPSYNELFVSKETNKKMSAYYDKNDIRNYDDEIVAGVNFGTQTSKNTILQSFKPEMFGIYNAQDIVGRSSGTSGQGGGNEPTPVNPTPVNPTPVNPMPVDDGVKIPQNYNGVITVILNDDKKQQKIFFDNINNYNGKDRPNVYELNDLYKNNVERIQGEIYPTILNRERIKNDRRNEAKVFFESIDYTNKFPENEVLYKLYDGQNYGGTTRIDGNMHIKGLKTDVITENHNIKVTFDVYNHESTSGVVEVYDADGNRIKTVWIEPFRQRAENLQETVHDFSRLVRINELTAAKTPIKITVPAGGYFRITNNEKQSPSLKLHNLVKDTLESTGTIVNIIRKAGDIPKDVDNLLKEEVEGAITDVITEAVGNELIDLTVDSGEDYIKEGVNKVLDDFMNGKNSTVMVDNLKEKLSAKGVAESLLYSGVNIVIDATPFKILKDGLFALHTVLNAGDREISRKRTHATKSTNFVVAY